MIEIPLPLRSAIESGSCILFIGAGIGNHLLYDDKSHAPDGETLAIEMAKKFGIQVEGKSELTRISKIVELRHGRSELISFLQKRFSSLTPDESFQWLFSLKWAAIFTTNYDRAIQRAYELIPNPPQKPLTIHNAPDIESYDSQFEVPIIHLHGSLYDTDSPNVIITDDDYIQFQEKRRMLFELLRIDFAKSPFLYIGYSNRDSDWKKIQKEVEGAFYPSSIPQSFRIDPYTDTLDIEILESKNIKTINTTYKDFYDAASLIITAAPRESKRYLSIKKEVPKDLQPAFEKDPAAIARLINSWIYVNEAPFSGSPNIHDFLRGEKPNWALIGSREFFERDIEEDLYNEVLDFATSTKTKSKAAIILGPACYGITTLMMSLAARVVNDKAGIALMLKPGRSLLEGDIEYVTSFFESTEKKPFFFIDNASDFSVSLDTIFHRLNDLGKPAMLIMGERLNEWRQCHGRLPVKEFQINPLSDPEINRLLSLLRKHSELGVLSTVDEETQINIIKKFNNKELLVTLREATEGKDFDAIIEDEFRGIKSPLARQLYLAVSCFYQHGAFVRDSLIGQLLDVDLLKLYEATNDPLEGVVLYEKINPTKEYFAARTRHRIIAQIVWERCASAEEKDLLLSKSIGYLNLNYGIDKEAFDKFIRSDRNVDQLRTLDGKIRFFDRACTKDPNSPYVKQHYSRMLLREGKFELALRQVEEAIRIAPKNPVLRHTSGLVLMELAFSIESIEIARRRLVQSESSFRSGLAIYPRDEYCYQGLAQLFIGWAKKTSNPDESAEYITKAEEIINEGLKNVRVRSGLWIESSNIQKYLGDKPSCIEALEKAVRESPGSVVARFLLGRAYKKDNRNEQALEILKPNIENHPEEVRSFIEYAILLAIKNGSFIESISLLKQSSLYGYSDPRYIATLGGMLFMSEQFTDSKEVFNKSLEYDFTSNEQNEIQFYPWDFSDYTKPLRLKGKVVKIKAGYVLIESNGFPVFLCPGSKFGGLVLERGQLLSFQPSFSARGSIAISLIAE